MSYKRQRIDLSEERKIVLGMIVSDPFLKEIKYILSDISLLETSYARTVAKWCLEFYSVYECAPKTQIRDLFNQRKERIDDEDANIISDLLDGLETELEINYDHPYRLELAEKYHKEQSLKDAVEEINYYVKSGDLEKADSIISNYKRVVRPTSTGIDIVDSVDTITKALDDRAGQVFKMQGNLGDMLKHFYRGDLIAVAGSMKKGKSWWLQEIGLQAFNNELKVAFFTLEMMDYQMLIRLYQTILGETRFESEEPIEVPYFVEEGEKEYTIDYNIIEKKGISVPKILKVQNAMKRLQRNSGFKLFQFPAYAATTDDIIVALDNLAHFDNFIPDVIVVDYADILAPEKGSTGDYRHRLDTTWKTLRRLAQERNCLVVTATQTNRSTLKNDVSEDKIAEDIRKLAHVSLMIGLNQTPAEKKLGVMRMVTLVNRHDEFNSRREVVVLQQLAIGKPYIDSRWKDQVEYGEEKEDE